MVNFKWFYIKSEYGGKRIFYLQKGKIKKALYKQQNEDMCHLWRYGAIAESTACKWFARFKSGDFDLEDWEYFSKSAVIDDDQMKNNLGHMT